MDCYPIESYQIELLRVSLRMCFMLLLSTLKLLDHAILPSLYCFLSWAGHMLAELGAELGEP